MSFVVLVITDYSCNPPCSSCIHPKLMELYCLYMTVGSEQTVTVESLVAGDRTVCQAHHGTEQASALPLRCLLFVSQGENCFCSRNSHNISSRSSLRLAAPMADVLTQIQIEDWGKKGGVCVCVFLRVFMHVRTRVYVLWTMRRSLIGFQTDRGCFKLHLVLPGVRV